jgi:hypothetical protein
MSENNEIPMPTKEATTLEMLAFPADRLPKLNAVIDEMPHRLAKLLMEVIGSLQAVNVEPPAVENHSE